MNFKEAYKAMRAGKAISNTDHPDDWWIWENNEMRFCSGGGLSYYARHVLDFGYFLDQIVKDNWFIVEE